MTGLGGPDSPRWPLSLLLTTDVGGDRSFAVLAGPGHTAGFLIPTPAMNALLDQLNTAVDHADVVFQVAEESIAGRVASDRVNGSGD
jgi:hypothetical protein